MTFKDKTFCSARCAAKRCDRMFTDWDQAAYNRWAATFDDPSKATISWADFSANCHAYIPKDVDTE